MNADILRAPLHVLRLRRRTSLILVVALVAVAATQAVTVASLRDDPGIPPTRLALPLACACANLSLLLVRAVLPDQEELSWRRMPTVRAVTFAWVQILGAGSIAVAALLQPGPGTARGLHCAVVLAMVTAVGLAASRVALSAGLALPWIYVIVGLVLGYDASGPGGRATVRPWAWLVDDSIPLGWTIVAAIVLTGLAAALPSAQRSATDDL